MDETWHSQLGQLHKALARPWHCHAAQLRSAGSRWQLQGKDSAHPALNFGAKTTRGFILIFCTHSPPLREVHMGISVQHHMERMWKDDWFLPGL